MTEKRIYHFLVDSSALRSQDLEEYLREDTANIAVISEVTAFEPYKNRKPDAIGHNLEICCRYPNQLRVLRGTGDIIALEKNGPIAAGEYIDPVQTRGSGEFCDALQRAVAGDPAYLKAIGGHVVAVEKHLFQVRAGMSEVVEGLRAFGRTFSPTSLSALRRGELYPAEVLERSWEFITDLAHSMFAQHYPEQEFDVRAPGVAQRLLFRYAAAGTVLALWWTRKGGLEAVRADRLTNDLIDLQQVALAIKYDGLLTMDSKLMDIYSETSALMTVIEESLGSRSTGFA